MLVVRQALTGLAHALELDGIETNDLNTAVTEAANNVVMHAYDGSEGALEVRAHLCEGTLTVLVRDYGIGIQVHQRVLAERGVQSSGAGMGLAVIDALARESAFVEPADGGTEVRMDFPLRSTVALEPTVAAATQARAARAGDASAQPPDGIELEVGPSSLTRVILPRVLSALAARAHFTTDRISDVHLIADVLAANASDSLDGSQLEVDTTVSTRALELRIGPLHRGRGESLMAAAFDGMAPVIDRLTDSKRVASSDDLPDTLELRLVDRR